MSIVPVKPTRCFVCGKPPEELVEYIEAARECEQTPSEYVRLEEGTFNRETGSFCCTPCYIKIGMPSSPEGWVAPWSEYPCHVCDGLGWWYEGHQPDDILEKTCSACHGTGTKSYQAPLDLIEKGTHGMNYNTLLFLINKDLRAVAGIYEAEEEKGQKPVPRAIFKTLDPELKVGDYVLVPTGTRHRMSVNKIVEVDIEVDFEHGGPIPWIIGSSTDKTEFNRLVRLEENAIAQVKSAEKRKAREALRDTLLKDNEFLTKLPIASLNGELDAVPEQPNAAAPKPHVEGDPDKF